MKYLKKTILVVVLLSLFVVFLAAREWQWASSAGGRGSNYGISIAVDGEGNSYITGDFGSSATFGETTPIVSTNLNDMYVAKMNNAGEWQWAKRAGSGSGADGQDIAVDNQGSSYVTGTFVSPSF